MAVTTFARCPVPAGAPRPLRRSGGAGADDGGVLQACRRALAVGAVGIEARARLSADGQVVLADQQSYRPSLRRRAVAQLETSALAALGVPRLGDLYASLAGDFQLCLELADRETMLAVLALSDAAGRTAGLWIRSPDQEALAELRTSASSARLVHDLSRRAYGDTLERHLADLAAGAVDGLALPAAEWSLGLATLVHRFGLVAYAPQTREERHLRNLVAASVDAISSTAVERLVAVAGDSPRPESPANRWSE